MKTATQLFTIMQKAVAHHQEGRLLEAEQAYLKVLNIDHRHADALRFLGGLYMQRNQAKMAAEYFKQALDIKPDNPELLNNLGVALYHQGKHDEAIACYQQAVQIKPDYAEAINNMGNLYFEFKKFDEAIVWFERYLQLQPQNAKIHTILGNLLRNAGRSQEASVVYQRLIELAQNDTSVHLNLGTIFHDMGKWDEAMEQYEQVLKLQPDSCDAMINYGSLCLELDRPGEALASYEKTLQLQPQSLDAKWGKSLALLMLGDYNSGWTLYETRFERKTMQSSVPFHTKRWDGSDFSGKTLLIWAEQGLGDALQFIRYAALCKKRGGKIIVMCPEPLMRLFKSCPFIDAVVISASENDFDYQIPVMSLPHIFGTTLETIPQNIPYLYVSEDARQKWAMRFTNDGFFKVGLVWAGNPRKNRIDAHITDRQRSMNLGLMKSILGFDNCRFYSLQKGSASGEIEMCGLREQIIDYMPDAVDFMDTAALIENLDLVISVDTSVVHLAGALGKPVWVLSRYGGCWRWLRNQEFNPWYPSARVFSQPNPGDWKGCIDKVRAALENELCKRGIE